MKGKFAGCLLGLAVGDALGMATEGLTALEIKNNYGLVTDYVEPFDRSPRRYLLPGQYTDDTEQMLALANSLLEAKEFSPEKAAAFLCRCTRTLGKGSREAFARLQAGIPWHKSGSNSPGNGAAMKVAPLALLYWDDEERLTEHTVALSRITHQNNEAVAGALAISLSVSKLLQGTPPELLPQQLIPKIAPYCPEMAQQIECIPLLLDKPLENTIGILGTEGRSLRSVPTALFLFIKNPCDYYTTIINSINAGGDTDTIAAMSGALSGLFNGIDSIPKVWLEHLEDCKLISQTAEKLWELYKSKN